VESSILAYLVVGSFLPAPDIDTVASLPDHKSADIAGALVVRQDSNACHEAVLPDSLHPMVKLGAACWPEGRISLLEDDLGYQNDCKTDYLIDSENGYLNYLLTHLQIDCSIYWQTDDPAESGNWVLPAKRLGFESDSQTSNMDYSCSFRSLNRLAHFHLLLLEQLQGPLSRQRTCQHSGSARPSEPLPLLLPIDGAFVPSSLLAKLRRLWPALVVAPLLQTSESHLIDLPADKGLALQQCRRPLLHCHPGSANLSNCLRLVSRADRLRVVQAAPAHSDPCASCSDSSPWTRGKHLNNHRPLLDQQEILAQSRYELPNVVGMVRHLLQLHAQLLRPEESPAAFGA